MSVKQNYRPNIPTESEEDDYRVFYPFTDCIPAELDARFSQRSESVMPAAYLVPKALKKLMEESEEELSQHVPAKGQSLPCKGSKHGSEPSCPTNGPQDWCLCMFCIKTERERSQVVRCLWPKKDLARTTNPVPVPVNVNVRSLDNKLYLLRPTSGGAYFRDEELGVSREMRNCSGTAVVLRKPGLNDNMPDSAFQLDGRLRTSVPDCNQRSLPGKTSSRGKRDYAST
ncbi:hypothetical protein L3Q82_026838 [Scortum barcoo]|uniref:Uncharacterized protein n=1 Tax=Scortum barcoo TaxID=214431 RepID=A0ACB8WIX3_9TELE|nr:hypothetical protein L3Q82_026838 [Scortum barcoo]